VRRLSERAGRVRVRASRNRRPGVRFVAGALVGLLVLGGAVARVSGDDSGRARPTAAKTPIPTVAAVDPGEVTVAVLNGTTVPGLAAALREQLAAAGFIRGMINTASNQQLAESVVQYSPGHEAEAKAVGRRLGIRPRALATAESRARIGDAPVIVIAGADKAP
jgi:hypothetical protein